MTVQLDEVTVKRGTIPFVEIVPEPVSECPPPSPGTVKVIELVVQAVTTKLPFQDVGPLFVVPATCAISPAGMTWVEEIDEAQLSCTAVPVDEPLLTERPLSVAYVGFRAFPRVSVGVII